VGGKDQTSFVRTTELARIRNLVTRQRPFGVTILAVLQTLLGILLLLGVFALTVAGFRLSEVVPHVRLFPVRFSVVMITLFVLAAIDFVLAYGLWIGSTWAWKISLVFAVVGTAFFIFSIFLRPGIGEITSLVIDVLALYYLMQPRVQAYYRKDSAALT